MHPPITGKPLCYEEKEYLKEFKEAKKKNVHPKDLTFYETNILRDRQPDHTMNDDVERGSIDSRYAKLNQVEYLSRSQFLPFREDMFIGNKEHDPRGYTNDPIMENVKKFSYERSKYTDATLYPRNMPVVIIDSIRPYNKLQEDFQYTVNERKKRIKVFSESETNDIFVKRNPTSEYDDQVEQKTSQAQDQEKRDIANEKLAPEIVSMPRNVPGATEMLSVADHKLPVGDYQTLVKTIKYESDPALLMKVIESLSNRHDSVNVEKVLESLSNRGKEAKLHARGDYTVLEQYEEAKVKALDKIIGSIVMIEAQNKHAKITKKEGVINVVYNHKSGDQKETIVKTINIKFDPTKVTSRYELLSHDRKEELETCTYSNRINNLADVSVVIEQILDQKTSKLSENEELLLRNMQTHLRNFENAKQVPYSSESVEEVCRIMQDLGTIIRSCKEPKQVNEHISTVEHYIEDEELSGSIKSAILGVLQNETVHCGDVESLIGNKKCINIKNHMFSEQRDRLTNTLNITPTNLKWLSKNPAVNEVEMVIMDEILKNSELSEPNKVQFLTENPAANIFGQTQDRNIKDFSDKLLKIIIEIKLEQNSEVKMGVNDERIREEIEKELLQRSNIPLLAEEIEHLITTQDEQTKDGTKTMQYSKETLKDSHYSADLITADEKSTDHIETMEFKQKQLEEAILEDLTTNDIELETIFESMNTIKKSMKPDEIAFIIGCMVAENAKEEMEHEISSDMVEDMPYKTLITEEAEGKIFCNYREIRKTWTTNQQEQHNFGDQTQSRAINIANPYTFDTSMKINIETDETATFEDEYVPLKRNRDKKEAKRHNIYEEKSYELSSFNK